MNTFKHRTIGFEPFTSPESQRQVWSQIIQSLLKTIEPKFRMGFTDEEYENIQLLADPLDGCLTIKCPSHFHSKCEAALQSNGLKLTGVKYILK